MILILTDEFDPHADHVIPLLKARGAEVLRFNPADFPSQAHLSVDYGADGAMRSVLRVRDSAVDLTRIQAVWQRRPRPPIPHEQLPEEGKVRDFVAEECKTFVQDLWHALPCPWLPGRPAAIQRAQFKASQLRLASQVGMELPPTLMTNDRREFLEFYNRHDGNVVSKMIGSSFYKTVGLDSFSRYTEVVSKRDVAYASSIEYCPIILQAYVPKQLELRITVVGRRVFAAEIHSQRTHHTRHDWRRYDLDNTPHYPHELPPDVKTQCLRLVDRLDLCYGAIDMILTPDGRYVFVEINPSGQYLWIEHETGLEISAAICDFLIGGE